MALEYTAEANAQLTEVENGTDRQLLRAINDVLDHIEEAPGDAVVRAQRLDDTTWGSPIFAVIVRRPEADWVVLWRPDGDVQTICYVGPIPGE